MEQTPRVEPISISTIVPENLPPDAPAEPPVTPEQPLLKKEISKKLLILPIVIFLLIFLTPIPTFANKEVKFQTPLAFKLLGVNLIQKENKPEEKSSEEVTPTAQPTIEENQAAPNAETANWKTYANTKVGYSLKYPSDKRFEVKENESKNTVFIMVEQSDYGLIIKTYANPNTLNADQWIKENFDTRYKSVELNGKKVTIGDLKLTNKKVSDQPAVEVRVGDLPSYLLFTSPDKQQIIEIAGSTLEESLLDQILSTFKFLDQQIDTTNWKTFENNQLTFKYPAYWSISVAKDKIENQSTLNEWVKETTKNWSTSLTKETTIGDKQAITQEEVSAPAGRQMKAYILNANNDVILIAGVAVIKINDNGQSYNEGDPTKPLSSKTITEFDQILSTLKFTP